eukprot:95169_1
MSYHTTTTPNTTHSSRRTSLPAQHVMNSPHRIFSTLRSVSNSNLHHHHTPRITHTNGYRRMSSAPTPTLTPLYQSFTPDPEDLMEDVEAKANDFGVNLRLPPLPAKFSGRNLIDVYTPISEHSNTSNMTPDISRSSSYFTSSPMSRMSTIASVSPSDFSLSSSYSNIQSSPYSRPSLHIQNQHSPVFKRPHIISSPREDNPTTHKPLKGCPNMAHDKCQCKALLYQNVNAQVVWSQCYRFRMNNKNYATDNREIEVSYFEGLYQGLCSYLRQEIDSDRMPTKRDISIVMQKFGGFTSEKGELIMDRCHFISFWKWFEGACNILKDVYNLWDSKYPFQINIFMDRKECEEILNLMEDGTFLVRLSSRPNALVVSYVEQMFDHTNKIRHLLFIRKSSDCYTVKTNKNSHKSAEINKLIRAFGKLQSIYTPKCIYKK